MPLPAPVGDTRAVRRRIRVRGLVQGVGFRPHVYRCAEALGLAGFVSNGPEGVLIEVEGQRLEDFLDSLREDLPPLARIDSLIQAPLPALGDSAFRIAPTTAGAAAGAAIPADVAICDDCLGELFDPRNRRYLHPFIACCNCGPRYAMTRQLPYDRDNTAMAEFDMCGRCEGEYIEPTDRRFHAEPIACHDCGPRLSSGIDATAAALLAGEVVALKGVGGYHLACDARNEATVARLRACKRRDGKPFAVMVLNLASAARHVDMTGGVDSFLRSPERPVVIAPALPEGVGLSETVSPGLGTLGLMLPSTAVHYLLFHALSGAPTGRDWLRRGNDLALVMTSANVSGEPLVATRAEAEQKLAGIADRFLHHDREIPARVDDSVVRVSRGVSTLVRRARGYTPHAVKLSAGGSSVLALGPHLKSTITMTHGNRAHLSPHVGDLDTAASVAFHARTAEALRDMLKARPEVIACDLSRDFASTRLAEQLSESMNLPLVRVQHHHAHVAAVLAEHRHDEAALGLALDGHGLGLDGESWGGELLLVDGARFQRLGHLAPLALPGGDRAAREPWRMAAAALHKLGRGEEVPGRFPGEPMAAALVQLLDGDQVGTTTAAGRLFDAAAGLLGVSQRAAFEGEAPMLLEGLVRSRHPGSGAYQLKDGVLGFEPLLDKLADCKDRTDGAGEFHATLVQGLEDWVVDGARRSGVGTVVLSGGCFLNAQLSRALPERLEAAGLSVLQARSLPPNDAAISLGQAWVARLSE